MKWHRESWGGTPQIHTTWTQTMMVWRVKRWLTTAGRTDAQYRTEDKEVTVIVETIPDKNILVDKGTPRSLAAF